MVSECPLSQQAPQILLHLDRAVSVKNEPKHSEDKGEDKLADTYYNMAP